MSLQILTLKLDGTTAGDYLTWCRDPDPPALDLTLRSIRIQAEPLGDTITAILDWNQPAPAPTVAAAAAGLPLTADIQIHLAMPTAPTRTLRSATTCDTPIAKHAQSLTTSDTRLSTGASAVGPSRCVA
jgi:hypothetical protein